MFIELATGVYAVENRWVAGMAGIVLGKNRALAIDTCGYPDEGEAMATFIREHGHGPSWVALTHGHGDHILGAEALNGCEVFAHDLTPGVIARQVPALAEKRDQSHEQVSASLPWPTVTYSHELTIDLGNRQVRLFHAPGHSADGACALVQPEGILFGGDTVVTGIVPAIADGDSRDLERTLTRLLGMEIEVLVPGHGQVVRGSAEILDWLRFWIGYLNGIRMAAGEGIKAGNDPEATIDSIAFEQYVGDRLAEEPYGMRRRHRATVSKIVHEELAGRPAKE